MIMKGGISMAEWQPMIERLREANTRQFVLDNPDNIAKLCSKAADLLSKLEGFINWVACPNGGEHVCRFCQQTSRQARATLSQEGKP